MDIFMSVTFHFQLVCLAKNLMHQLIKNANK